MKRNFPSANSGRPSTGCLPVPIFNQKKRNRLPLTSIPQRNEPNPSCFPQSPERFDFSAVSSAFSFKNNTKLCKDIEFADMPEEEMVQTVPLCQMTFKEKQNSLRIIPASIESMKHWSEYTDRVPLLFELLATLDSAVTSGDHGSKIFLFRDGTSHIPCVFYEMDRDLPRLIRGRVHRSVGNFDKKRHLFKCVSVRPASGAEQQTFKDFITAANKEMEGLIKTINEI
ncbi:spermatogenesis-associated protein 22 [Pelodytes ibericus]